MPDTRTGGARGFTLIEVVMVAVIIAIVIGVALSRYLDLRSDSGRSAARQIGAAIAESAHMLHMRYAIRRTNYIMGTTRGPVTGVLFNANIGGASAAANTPAITVSGRSARIIITVGRYTYTMTYTAGSGTMSPRVRFNNF